jgi:predicted nucleic acid-binding protein
MLYLDTSLVVSLVAVEPSTGVTQQWLAEQLDETLVISDWVLTEVASALSLIQRGARLAEPARWRAEHNLQSLMATAFGVLPVTRQAFRTAATMSARVDLRLRAGDALHVAVAAENGAQLATRDVAQARAAHTLGLPSVLLAAPDEAAP